MLFEINETIIIYGIITFHWINYFIKLSITLRQYIFCKKMTDIPEELHIAIDPEDFVLNRKYSLAKQRRAFVKNFISAVVPTIIVFFKLPLLIWSLVEYSGLVLGNEVIMACIWKHIMALSELVTNFSFILIYTYIYNAIFSKEENPDEENKGFFGIIRNIRHDMYELLRSLPMSILRMILTRFGGANRFIWMWFLSMVMDLIIVEIYPVFIEPILFRTKSLPYGLLRLKIEEIGRDLNDPFEDIRVAEGRKVLDNMYYSALLQRKQVIVSDKLLQGYEVDEALAIVLHDLGHRKNAHILKKFVAYHTLLCLKYSLISDIHRSPLVYTSFGFTKSQPPVVGLAIIEDYIMVLFNTCQSFFLTYLTRLMEFESDVYVVEQGYGDGLVGALKRTPIENNVFPVYDIVYSTLRVDYPPQSERIRAVVDLKSE